MHLASVTKEKLKTILAMIWLYRKWMGRNQNRKMCYCERRCFPHFDSLKHFFFYTLNSEWKHTNMFYVLGHKGLWRWIYSLLQVPKKKKLKRWWNYYYPYFSSVDYLCIQVICSLAKHFVYIHLFATFIHLSLYNITQLKDPGKISE